MSLQVIAVSATAFSLFEEAFDEPVILASFLVEQMKYDKRHKGEKCNIFRIKFVE